MKYIKPIKVISSSENISNVENLFKDFPNQIQINCNNYARFNGPGFVILDFGKEHSGGIRIFTNLIAEESTVRIRFGESVGETCSDIGIKGSTNDHSPRDFTVKIPHMSDLTFGQTGFRFVRIDFSGEFWNLRNILASVDTDEREEVGFFNCDDELLNKIWGTASYTLRLCLHNGLFWDGVKRDRLCWIGDAYPEAIAAYDLYENPKEIKNTLDFILETTKGNDWCCDMPTYNLWFILIVCEKYLYDGNKEDALNYSDFILSTLKKYNELIDEDGTTHLPINFIDWPSHYNGGDGEELIKKSDEIVGVSYLLKLTAQRAINLFKELENFEIIDVSNEILRKINNSKLSVTKYKQIAALGVACGEYEGKLDILLKDGPLGLSTFQSYFILSALAHFGKYDEALSFLKKYYGGMLSVGSTTFWEDFDLEWLDNCSRIDEMPNLQKKDIHGDYGKFCYKGYRHSLCHGWSAGVIHYIVENIVGLKRIDSTHFVLKPHLSDLKHIECNVPTIKGLIKIKIDNTLNEQNIEITTPKGICITK
mgnify:CR=1 FL=1